MLKDSNIDSNIYSDLMNTIKKMNSEYRILRKSKTYKIGMAVEMSVLALRKMQFSTAKKQFLRWYKGVKSKQFLGVNRKIKKERIPNYFSEHRIAVYSVVFGKYDIIPEPYYHPDNIDYFLITDQSLDLTNSVWQKMDISNYEQDIKELNNIEKNRYFKMFPHLLFPKYKYSIYIDGNVQVISDLTEYIYHLEECGLAAHMHSMRDCVYEESGAIIFSKKEKRTNMEKHIKHLMKEAFPKHYGMLECNVLVREHNSMCKKIMEMWWEEFTIYSKRDQISLPYVLYKNNISIDEVGTLGDNVYENPSFRIHTHNI